MKKTKFAQRSYKLRLYGNKIKTDTALYTLNRFRLFYEHFVGRCFFGQRSYTTGMGSIANQALYKANNTCRALKKLNKATGIKTNIPYKAKVGCYAKIEKSKRSFDYWVSVSNLWTKHKMVRLPAKSHKALNSAIREGWKLSSLCEINVFNGNLYAVVFLKKEIPARSELKHTIGCDVGIKHSVVTSDGYLGYGLSKIIKTQKMRHAERRRQGHKISNKSKTCIKQILDREAKLLMRRSLNSRAILAVENPKRIANLKAGSLHGWARCYFANRLHTLGSENGVPVLDINPFRTSITCSKCGAVDKESRRNRDEFVCVKCGHSIHADVNASVVIAQKGTVEYQRRKHSGMLPSRLF